MHRRQFLALGAATSTSLLSACVGSPQLPFKAVVRGAETRRPIELGRYYPTPPPRAAKPLRILFLGGTNFLGPATVQWLGLRGHEVTLFNRGLTNPNLFPALRHIKGDRLDLEAGHEGLGTRENWDVVIDTWSGGPECVTRSANVLRGRVNHYIYVSSIAVYKMVNYQRVGGIDESTPLPVGPGLKEKPQSDLDYATRKLVADRAIQEIWPGDQITVLRPHLIPGAHQEKMNGVESYWPMRFQIGGSVLAPGDGSDPTQWIDVRDVGWFIAHAAEKELTGIYNLGQQQSLATLFSELMSLSPEKSTLNWVSWPQLQKIKAGPFHELPMYVPQQEGSFYNISDARARAAGLQYRGVQTVYPMVIEDYYYQYGRNNFVFGRDGEPGLTLAREASLLAQVQT